MEGYESTILGTGVLPVKEIIDAGRNSGGDQFIFSLNRNLTRGKTPLACAKDDYNIMKKWGY